MDWRAGEIDIPGKGGRRERLPLPDDVGQALVGYLRRGRPETSDRSLFVRLCAPRTGLSSGGVTGWCMPPAPRWRCGDRSASTSAHGRGPAAERRRAAVGDLPAATSPPSSHDRDLREGRSRRWAAGTSLAGGCVMSTMRQAAEDYLALRRAMGFKLDKPGRLVLQFADHLDRLGAAR